MNDEARIPERKIVRDTDGDEDGQFAKAENAGKEGFNVETLPNHSRFIRESIKMLQRYEDSSFAPDELGALVTWIVNGPTVNG